MTRESLAALLRGVWAGDTEAAARLVRQHGAEIRRLARLYLTDPQPCRVAGAPDAWRSVLTMFLERAAAGRLDLRKPEQLHFLLSALARRAARTGARPADVAPPPLAPPEEQEVCHD